MMSDIAPRYVSHGDRLYESRFLNLEIGQRFELADLSETAGFDLALNRGPLYDAIERALKEQGLLIESVWGEMAYEVIHPNRAPEAMAKRLERALAQLRFAYKIGHYTDSDLMDSGAKAQLKMVKHETEASKRAQEHSLGRVKQELEDFGLSERKKPRRSSLEGMTRKQLIEQLRTQGVT